jgi:hypothetical protein
MPALNCWLVPAGRVVKVGEIVMATVSVEVLDDPPHPTTKIERETAKIRNKNARSDDLVIGWDN